MNLRVSISRRAEEDLTRQYRWYLDQAGVQLAERFIIAFDSTVKNLACHPKIGRKRHFRARELASIHSFPVGLRFGAHLIFYRCESSVLEIVRVMHGARDIPRRLLEPSEQ